MYRYMDVPFEKESIQEDGTFKGYGSTFGGKPDSYGDIIALGAFSETLVKGGRNGTGIAMLYQHDSKKPIGVYTSIVENTRGLAVEGQLAMKTQSGAETYELMKMGALRGLSIGWDYFRDKEGKPLEGSFEVDEKKKTTLLKKISLWEISPVTFPANTRARITGVKSLEDAMSVRDFEKALRELGLSRNQALYIAKLCEPNLRESSEGEGVKDIMDHINQVTSVSDSRNLCSSLMDSLNRANQLIKGD